MNINWIAVKKINNTRVNNLFKNNIKTNQFTNYGPNVQLLEKIIKEKLKIDETKEVICVCNGSVAIHSLILAINYYYNKEIKWATQSFTFPPSAQGPLKDCLICDIDEEGGLDLLELEKYEKQNDIKIDGIIVTNFFGNLVDINRYETYCKKNNKILLFDNAATPYSFYKNKNACNYGDGSTISFHHTKPIGFGEGGAIIVNKEYADIIRKLNNFGICLQKEQYFHSCGNNYKMSDISAIYIIQYLDIFNKIVIKHNKLYNYFIKKIKKLNNFKIISNYSDINNSLISCFCVKYLQNGNYTSDNIINKFNDNNIVCRKYYIPLKNTKKAVELYNSIICLPCNINITIKDINIYINILKEFN